MGCVFYFGTKLTAYTLQTNAHRYLHGKSHIRGSNYGRNGMQFLPTIISADSMTCNIETMIKDSELKKKVLISVNEVHKIE